MFISKCSILGRPIALNKDPSMRVFLSGTQFTVESTEAMQFMCLAQGHNILMRLRFEPLISVSKNQHLIHMTNIQCLKFIEKKLQVNSK